MVDFLSFCIASCVVEASVFEVTSFSVSIEVSSLFSELEASVSLFLLSLSALAFISSSILAFSSANKLLTLSLTSTNLFLKATTVLVTSSLSRIVANSLPTLLMSCRTGSNLEISLNSVLLISSVLLSLISLLASSVRGLILASRAATSFLVVSSKAIILSNSLVKSSLWSSLNLLLVIAFLTSSACSGEMSRNSVV